MDLTPSTAGDDDFPSDAVLRRPFPNPRPLRADLVAAHARASDDLAVIDAELEALLERRQACLRRIEPLRTRLNRRWTHNHVRRRARVDEPPVPPAPPGAVPLEGTDLREVCTTLLRRHGPQRLRDLHGLLHRYGYTVGGCRPVQRLGDAMAYEERCGRAERLERGVYAATAEGPRRVRRLEPAPGGPLPWEAPVTDPSPPLVDPPVVHDPQHWGADAWPAPPAELVADGPPGSGDGADGGDGSAGACADDADRLTDPPHASDPSAPGAPPPLGPAFGDDSSTNRPPRAAGGGGPVAGGAAPGRAAAASGGSGAAEPTLPEAPPAGDPRLGSASASPGTRWRRRPLRRRWWRRRR